jgi:hypothetical protein
LVIIKRKPIDAKSIGLKVAGLGFEPRTSGL